MQTLVGFGVVLVDGGFGDQEFLLPGFNVAEFAPVQRLYISCIMVNSYSQLEHGMNSHVYYIQLKFRNCHLEGLSFLVGSRESLGRQGGGEQDQCKLEWCSSWTSSCTDRLSFAPLYMLLLRFRAATDVVVYLHDKCVDYLYICAALSLPPIKVAHESLR